VRVKYPTNHAGINQRMALCHAQLIAVCKGKQNTKTKKNFTQNDVGVKKA
jgi:hypothetical protein